MPTALKRGLRRCVVASARPPFDALYRGLYGLITRCAVAALGRCRGVIAVYLCRGCARNDIAPGISDIDLTVVTTNDPAARDSARRICRNLGRITGHLVDYYPNLVSTRETLERRWRTAPAWQHRYREGQATWKLLHGTDVLGSLPPLTEEERKSACYAELHRWWLLFAQLLAGPRSLREDGILRNSICYKAVTEALNARRELLTGERGTDRAAALTQLDPPLRQKLADLAARRFLPADETLAEDTCSFLLKLFTELWDGFAREPFLRIRPGISQEVDCRKEELCLAADEARIVEALRRHLADGWGRRFLGLHAVRSAFWNMEDLLLIVDADRDRAPGFRELAELTALRDRLRGEGVAQSFLFLRLGQVAFPLTPVLPADLHRGLLTPATMPDVFLQLGADEVWWSDYAEWYLCQWPSNEQWLDASDEKKRQLELIADSARQGRVVYPLTRDALERAGRRLRVAAAAAAVR